MPDLTPDRLAWGLTYYVVLLFSLSVHESAHGWMALRMGDDTAARQGRVTLNPLAHIDPVGTLLIPMLQIFWGGMPLFGWAKPTPVGAHNFKRLARGHVLVAGAGPLSNLLLAAPLHRGACSSACVGPPARWSRSWRLLTTGVQINVLLALFNLVPCRRSTARGWPPGGSRARCRRRYDRVVSPTGSGSCSRSSRPASWAGRSSRS